MKNIVFVAHPYRIIERDGSYYVQVKKYLVYQNLIQKNHSICFTFFDDARKYVESL